MSKKVQYETNPKFISQLEKHLTELCVKLPHRHPGSIHNQQATKYAAGQMAQFRFQVETPEFECIDWVHGDVSLKINEKSFSAFVGPYSLPFEGEGELIVAKTLDDLHNLNLANKIVLLAGDLVKEQLMPKSFVFYNPEHHQHIIKIVEEKQPAAIIAATGRNPELAGGWYPFPLFEDGDFDIPNCYIKDVDGVELEKFAGQNMNLYFHSKRIQSKGCNVIAKKGTDGNNRIIICAHIDSKITTRGALDNATGVTILLGLAELLAEYNCETTIELIAFNGEDYYSIPGQMNFLAANQGKFETIKLAINIDAAGCRGQKTDLSFYNVPQEFEERAQSLMPNTKTVQKGEPWPQSDHMIFVANNRPAMALTSANFAELSTTVTHTDKDTIDMVDIKILGDISHFIKNLVTTI